MLSAGLHSILARRRLSQWPIIATIGAIAALGQEPFGIWPVTILALGLIFALIRKAGSARQALGIGWIAGAGYFALALSWIVEPFFEIRVTLFVAPGRLKKHDAEQNGQILSTSITYLMCRMACGLPR